MDNFEHHDKAQAPAGSHSACQLARRVVELDGARGEALGLNERWTIREKKACYVLDRGSKVVATWARPDAEEKTASKKEEAA